MFSLCQLRLRLHQPPLHRRLQDAGAGHLEFGLDALQGDDGFIEAGELGVDLCCTATIREAGPRNYIGGSRGETAGF